MIESTVYSRFVDLIFENCLRIVNAVKNGRSGSSVFININETFHKQFSNIALL